MLGKYNSNLKGWEKIFDKILGTAAKIEEAKAQKEILEAQADLEKAKAAGIRQYIPEAGGTVHKTIMAIGIPVAIGLTGLLIYLIAKRKSE